MKSKKICVPPHGYIAAIAKALGYNRDTVSDAIRHNSRGVKAEKVREYYRVKYMNK